jgi:hypothetical protein
MSNSIYTPITTPFANTEFVSIRVDNIDYYIVSQLPMDVNGISGFPVHQKTAQRDFKRILGKGISVTKFATSLNSGKVVCISHEQLSAVVSHFSFKKDCLFTQALLEASFNTELRRANDYQRGCLEKEEYYQELLAVTDTSYKNRHKYTNYIQKWEKSGIAVNYGYLTIEVYRHTNLLDRYFMWKAENKTPSARKKNRFRGTLNLHEVAEISSYEDMVATIGTNHNLSPQDAIKLIKGEA